MLFFIAHISLFTVSFYTNVIRYLDFNLELNNYYTRRLNFQVVHIVLVFKKVS